MPRAFTQEDHNRLRKLWMQGLSESEIGRRLDRDIRDIRREVIRLQLPTIRSVPFKMSKKGDSKPQQFMGKRQPMRIATLPPLPSEENK